MTNYTKSTNFTSKDSLASGNPLKIVKGTEIDSEFNNIATAVSTKADLLSPTFTGVPLAPTAASGTNTTQVATTAFATAALQAVFPIGSIYINASVSTNPATLFGFGTWVAFGGGKVPVGITSADASFDVLEETGGSKDAVVVSHTHTATSVVTDPGHSHVVGSRDSTADLGGNYTTEFITNINSANGPNIATSTSTTGITVATTNASAGVSGTNANLMPYIVVAMWKRVS